MFWPHISLALVLLALLGVILVQATNDWPPDGR